MNSLPTNQYRHSAFTANMGTWDRALSITGGTIALIAACRSGVRAKTLLGVLGGEMLRRGLTGHCHAYDLLGVNSKEANPDGPAVPYGQGVESKYSVIIDQPRERLYAFWREVSNLPKVMRHLQSVELMEGNRSRWVVAGPAGTKLEWIAEIINEIPDELIAWQSIPGSTVSSAGSVKFKDAPGHQGTEIAVHLRYIPPAGAAGAMVAKLFGRDAQTEIEEDLHRLKEFFEAGEAGWSQGRAVTGPSGRDFGE